MLVFFLGNARLQWGIKDINQHHIAHVMHMDQKSLGLKDTTW